MRMCELGNNISMRYIRIVCNGSFVWFTLEKV